MRIIFWSRWIMLAYVLWPLHLLCVFVNWLPTAEPRAWEGLRSVCGVEWMNVKMKTHHQPFQGPPLNAGFSKEQSLISTLRQQLFNSFSFFFRRLWVLEHRLQREIGFNEINLLSGFNDHNQIYDSPGKRWGPRTERRNQPLFIQEMFTWREWKGKRIILQETCNNDTYKVVEYKCKVAWVYGIRGRRRNKKTKTFNGGACGLEYILSLSWPFLAPTMCQVLNQALTHL